MELLSVALLALAAYLIGSVVPSYYVARYRQAIDIRSVGSRNAGTLNTFHHVGPWWALVVLIFDTGKGAIAVLLPLWVGAPQWAVFITAPAVLAGHNWPILLKFQGGKGAASLMGICLAFAPLASMISLIPGIIATFGTKNGIAGLVIGFATLNTLLLAAWVFAWDQLAPQPGWHQLALSLPLTLLVAIVYGITIRKQLMRAIRERSVKVALYGTPDRQ